jgi:hypothetical protein
MTEAAKTSTEGTKTADEVPESIKRPTERILLDICGDPEPERIISDRL